MSRTIYTVGHSTLALADFLSLIEAHGVQTIADVRRFPMSRRHPQFNRDTLDAALRAAGGKYFWLPELGGRRRPRPDSSNTAWRNESFRGYADYMETATFAAAAQRLEEIAAANVTAILCAEAVWWRCHRSLIADYLTVRGYAVCHILDPRTAESHRYTQPARVVDGKLSYVEARLI
jgi:uncharacterized protein (DUF488 family)